ncbi:hypothetical protein PG984_010269 [Apiospora sp. TS-2023a]
MPHCEPCDRPFKTKAAWKRHVVISPHELHASTKCRSYDRVFVSTEALQKHLEDSKIHRKGSANTKTNQRVSQVLIDSTNTSTSFTFPQLHQAVLDESLELVPPPRFSKKLEMAQRQYETHVTARFTCDHCAAGSVWSSGMVGIEIRGSHDNQYYSAIVYNQRCKRCKGLGSMELDEGTYIERVSYRLKKWAGVKVEAPDYSNKATPPIFQICVKHAS